MPRQKKDFLLNPFVIIFILIIVIFAGFNFYQNMVKLNKIESRIEKIELQIAESEAKQKDLEAKIKNSNSDEYIEEVAREKLGLVKKGEKVFIPVEENNSNQKENKGD
ncbi:MAG: FtsB family cell division protein [Bacillota bacterium]